MYNYPHTINNGHGEEISFLKRVNDRIELIASCEPGKGPGMHVHHQQEEGLTVVEGKMAYQRLGEEVKYAEVGESVVFKAGEAHRFWNAAEHGLLKLSGYISPAHNVEFFLTELYKTQKMNGGRPDPFTGAYLLTHFKSEFDFLEIPPFVKKMIFPIFYQLGKVLGKYKQFEHAPLAMSVL